MTILYNPSLQEESRYEPAQIICPTETESLLNWLKRTGRLIPREIDTSQNDELLEALDDLIDSEIYKLQEEKEEQEEEKAIFTKYLK